MTSREAIHNFISGIFGTAVPSGSVYSGKSKPLLSYAAYSAPLSPVFGAKAEGFIDYYYIDDWDSGAAAENALAEFSRQDRKSTRLNSSHRLESRMPSSA